MNLSSLQSLTIHHTNIWLDRILVKFNVLDESVKLHSHIYHIDDDLSFDDDSSGCLSSSDALLKTTIGLRTLWP